MKKRLVCLLAGILLLTTTLTACGGDSGVGILSDFSATDLEGNAVDETILADHSLTMVNVWATFCTPCLSEMPALGELAKEYQSKGVQIIGLVSDTLDMDGELDDTQVETAADIVSETGADYLHLLPSSDLFGLLGQISSVPTTFFVNGRGEQVGSTYLGAKDKDDWRAIIDETLAQL